MRIPEVVVCAIIPFNEKIIMIKRATHPYFGSWSLPGGHLKFGEKLEEAVVREVREETGLKVQVRRLVDFMNFIKHDNGISFHYVIFCFECTRLSYSFRVGKEVLEVALIDPKNLDPETFPPPVKYFLKRENYL